MNIIKAYLEGDQEEPVFVTLEQFYEFRQSDQFDDYIFESRGEPRKDFMIEFVGLQSELVVGYLQDIEKEKSTVESNSFVFDCHRLKVTILEKNQVYLYQKLCITDPGVVINWDRVHCPLELYH